MIHSNSTFFDINKSVTIQLSSLIERLRLEKLGGSCTSDSGALSDYESDTEDTDYYLNNGMVTLCQEEKSISSGQPEDTQSHSKDPAVEVPTSACSHTKESNNSSTFDTLLWSKLEIIQNVQNSSIEIPLSQDNQDVLNVIDLEEELFSTESEDISLEEQTPNSRLEHEFERIETKQQANFKPKTRNFTSTKQNSKKHHQHKSNHKPYSVKDKSKSKIFSTQDPKMSERKMDSNTSPLVIHSHNMWSGNKRSVRKRKSFKEKKETFNHYEVGCFLMEGEIPS